MNWLDFGLHIVIAVVVLAIGLLLNKFIPSYLNKNGKNLGTKDAELESGQVRM